MTAVIPEGVRNYSHPSAQNDFLKAIEVGDAETVRSLLNTGGLSPMVIDVGFRRAAEYSTADVIRVFIESGKIRDVNAFNGIALTLAVGAGKVDNVHALLAGGADPSVNDNRALQLAIEGGYVDIVRALMSDSRVDPRVPEWRPFISILEAPENRVELLRLFLADRRVDPAQGNNWMQQTLTVSLQTPGLNSERKDEIEEMLALLRTGSRASRVGLMSQQRAGRRTRRRVKKMRRRGTRRY